MVIQIDYSITKVQNQQNKQKFPSYKSWKSKCVLILKLSLLKYTVKC